MDNNSRVSDKSLSAVGGGGLLALGVFALLWIVTGDAKTAATVMVFVLIVVGCTGLGMGAMYLGNRAIIDRLTEALVHKPLGDVIEADYTVKQLPSGHNDLTAIDNNMMVRREQLESTAAKIYIRLHPHTQPTREAIQGYFPQLRSNGYITAAMEILKERGLAEGGGQGRAYTWRIKDDAD